MQFRSVSYRTGKGASNSRLMNAFGSGGKAQMIYGTRISSDTRLFSGGYQLAGFWPREGLSGQSHSACVHSQSLEARYLHQIVISADFNGSTEPQSSSVTGIQ